VECKRFKGLRRRRMQERGRDIAQKNILAVVRKGKKRTFAFAQQRERDHRREPQDKRGHRGGEETTLGTGPGSSKRELKVGRTFAKEKVQSFVGGRQPKKEPGRSKGKI